MTKKELLARKAKKAAKKEAAKKAVEKKAKKKEKKAKKVAMYNGVEIQKNADGTLVCEKHVHLTGGNDVIGHASYRCLFVDGSRRMIPEEAYKSFK